MNLRLHMLVFLTLSTSSMVASANWFDGYGADQKAETTLKSTLITEVSYNKQNNIPINIYFLPQTVVPKAIVAPSFDIVAREMEQIKQQTAQATHEHALITYLPK